MKVIIYPDMVNFEFRSLSEALFNVNPFVCRQIGMLGTPTHYPFFSSLTHACQPSAILTVLYPGVRVMYCPHSNATLFELGSFLRNILGLLESVECNVGEYPERTSHLN